MGPLERIDLEVLEIEKEIELKTLEEKECRSDEQKLIEQQSELKREQSEILKKITQVKAEMREDVEDTKTIEEMNRYLNTHIIFYIAQF